MDSYECTMKHFAAGGKLVEVGEKAKFGFDPGSAWRKLEVATPSGEKKTAKDLQDEIKASTDIEFLNSMLDDERKSIVDAAEKRLAEIKPAE